MDLLAKIEERVDDIYKYLFEGAFEGKYIQRTEYELTIKNLAQDVSNLKSNQSKVVRAVITAIITAILGLVISNPFN